MNEFQEGQRVRFSPLHGGRTQYGEIISLTTHAARVDFDDERGIHIVARSSLEPEG